MTPLTPRAAIWALGGLAVCAIAAHRFGRELNGLFIIVPGLDKAAHCLGYGLLFLAVYTVSRAVGAAAGPARWLAAAAAVGIAIADEALQSVSPGRSIESLDVLAGCSGITLAWLAARRPRTGVAVATALVAVSVTGYAIYDTYVRLADFSAGLRCERQHDFRGARTHYLRALERGLRSSELFNSLAWVEIESGVGDARKALEYGKMALATDPTNPDVLDTYGWALHHNGRPEEALEYLLTAYAAKPHVFCIHYHLGAAYLALGRRDAAAAHFQRQTEITGTREATFALRALAAMGGQ